MAMELYRRKAYSLDAYSAGAEMTDIVERLRTVDISWSQEGEWCAEAADEIERLRGVLLTVLEACEDVNSPDRKVREEITRTVGKALKEKSDE